MSATPGRRRRAALAGLLALAALVAAAVLTGPPAGERAPLDPTSADPDGLRGLLDLAISFGQDVDIATELPSDTSVRLLLVRDRLGPRGREAVERWVRAGGRLVITDPASGLHDLEAGGAPAADLVGPSARTPTCDLAAVAEVDSVSHADWTPYRVPAGGTGCFPAGPEEAWLVAQTVGEGEVVALGSPAPLVNRNLDRDDNAVLAAGLLFPGDGAALRVLPPDAAAQARAAGEDLGASEGSDPVDLLPAGLPGALVLVGLAIGAGLLAAGRRLGQPVEETLPPTVPAAELARSVGDLLQRAGSRSGAAHRLRVAARDELATALGVDGDPQALARHAEARLGVPSETARRALLDLEVGDDEELVAVAEATSQLHAHLTRTAT